MSLKVSRRLSEHCYIVRSETFVNPADGTYDLIPIPRNAFVEDVWLEVETAGTGGTPNCTATIGFKGNKESADADGFIDATLGDTTAAGMIRATDDAQPASKGKWFNSGTGMITATFALGTTTTGPTGRIFVKYSIIS